MASRLLRSTDTGAPTLSTTPGSLNNVLKKVLVEGYGATAPLGWSLEFENIPSNEIVVRPGAGVRPFFRIMNNGNDARYNRAQVYMYQTMSDYNVGLLQSPEYGVTHPPSIKIRWNNTNSTDVLPWVVIGDAYGFYIIVKYGSVDYIDTVGNHHLWAAHYFGDYIPYDFTNVWNSCSIGHAYGTDGSDGYFITTAALNVQREWYQVFLRDIDKNVGYVTGSMFTPETYRFGNCMANADGTGISPIAGRMIGGNTLVQTGKGILGVMPGLINPYYVAPALTVDERKEFYVLDSGTKAFVFSDKYTSNDWNDSTHAQKIMILIGEGFRRAI